MGKMLPHSITQVLQQLEQETRQQRIQQKLRLIH